MQLDKFGAIAKKRGEWQAVDLGMTMARRWYGKLLLAWLLPVAPIFIALAAIDMSSAGAVSMLLWWFKPIWEKPLLYIVSRELFGEEVRLKSVFLSFWSIIKTDFWMSITLRRFTPSRSYTAPVSVLEGLAGAERSKRTNLLTRRFSGGATWSLIGCMHIELFLILGISAAVLLFMPQNVDMDWFDSYEKHTVLYDFTYYAVWMVCAALVAPFYVCMGFALYIQRRIDLEAWDIEIQFKRLKERRAKIKKKHHLTSLCLALAISLIGFGSVDNALANETAPNEPVQEQLALSAEQQTAHTQIAEIYEGEDFKNIEHQSGWRWITPEEQQEELFPEWIINFFEFIARNGGFFEALGNVLQVSAGLVEVIFWCCLAAIIIFVLYYFRDFIKHALSNLQATEEVFEEKPTMLFGLDVTEESLPDKICDTALAAWHEGKMREALSLLLRASIVELMQDHNCDFQDGYTESECAGVVRLTLDDKFDNCFSSLVKQWQLIAYAHAQDIDMPFEALVDSWRGVFKDV